MTLTLSWMILIMNRYKLINLYGTPAIELTEDPYEDVVFSYGKVLLEEEPEQDQLRLKFQLSIVRGDVELESNNDFIQYVGDILIEMIDAGLMKHDLVYTGGVDG